MNKKYKVFYTTEEVAEFDTFKEACEYIEAQLKNDKALDIGEFYIYSMV